MLQEIRENVLKETLEKSVKAIEKLGYKTKPINSQRFAVLVPRKDRLTTIRNIESRLGYTYDSKMKNASSLGALISPDGVLVVVKPDNVQGGNSAGMSNEADLEGFIRQFLEQQTPLDITFRGKNNIVEYSNVDDVKRVGTDTAGYKKADIQLFSKGKVVANLSLKQENAQIWESADTRYKDVVNQVIHKLLSHPFPDLGLEKSKEDNRIFRLYNPENGNYYGGIVITDLPKEDEEQIIFGTDTPKTVVIKHTFSMSDFTMLEDDELIIKSGIIFESLDDIDGTPYEPILFIRHDQTRVKSHGLRPFVYQKGHAYNGDQIRNGKKEVSYNDITA